MQDAHDDHPRNGEDRRRRIDQVHRAIQAQQGRVDADDLTEILDELTADQLDTLLKQLFRPGQPPHDPSFAGDREPDQAESAGSDLHEEIVAHFRAGDGLPLKLFGGADLPLSLLVRPFLEANDFRSGTETSYRKAFERLIDVVGDRPPSALTSKDLDGYADALRAQRSNKGTREILSAATLAKDIGHIRQFFAAVAGSQPGRQDPATTLEVPKRSKAPAGASRITPFSEDQLARLGRAPIFTGCEDSRHITRPGPYLCRDGRFWFGVLKPFAGVGSGEAMALLTTDVRRHHGIWHIDLHNDSPTGAGNRMVPVHPALIEIGFLEWVEERKAAVGDGRLFEPRKYARIWNDGVLGAVDLKAERVTVEGLRANFVEIVMASAPRPLATRLTGQAVGPTRARLLDRAETEAAARIVAALDFPGLRSPDT